MIERPRREGFAFAAAARGWEQLDASCASLPTQTALWVRCCAGAFAEPTRMLSAGRPEEPDAVVALVERGTHREMLGSGQLNEPTDVLWRTREGLLDLARTLVDEGVPLKLRRLPADSETIAAVRAAVGRRGVVAVRAGDGHPTLTLSPPWTEPGGGLAARRRSDLRRARRRAVALGSLEVELLDPTEAQVPTLLETAYAVESRSWKARSGQALARTPELARFFGDYMSGAAAA
ncbi:MAG: GNAT family N-acetyltransferase, partial [Solirubrobacteraceae bacterium]